MIVKGSRQNKVTQDGWMRVESIRRFEGLENTDSANGCSNRHPFGIRNRGTVLAAPFSGGKR